MTELVRITVEFPLPQVPDDLESCIKLVMHQMRTAPRWPAGEEGGTGHLNHVCHSDDLRCVGAEIVRTLRLVG